MATAPQRAWRAACPNCGAPVEFASAASASAVCSFCRSSLVRDGEALRRIGVVAELFDDHSPLQLGASGRFQGLGFRLVGRLQYGYEGGSWNEWHALFDTGAAADGGGEARSGWLSEDNGAYVFAFDATLDAAPALASLRPGQRIAVAGQGWDVASVVQARLLSAEGELPHPPRLDAAFGVVDLRNRQGEVGTLDYGDAARVLWSIGRPVALADLAMSGLREASEKTLGARTLACPNCGAALAPRLDSTKTLSCGQCRAVVDISAGVGAELAHYAQNNSGASGLEPQIALGRSATLALGGAALPWQAVGYLERCTVARGDADETYFWREYLLYHREAGFAFLVDAEDGWSWVRPITGVPTVAGDRAEWQGTSYRRVESYAARVSWVQGEFYWRIARDEQALVADYVGTGLMTKKRLSREQTAGEVTWSAGETIATSEIVAAFGIAPAAAAAFARAAPQRAWNIGLPRLIMVLIVLVVIGNLFSRCSDDGCSDVRSTFGPNSAEYRQCVANRGSGSRTGGGAYGGWSAGGGGHK